MDEEALDAAFKAGGYLPPRCLADDSGVSQSMISRLERGGDAHVSMVLRLFGAMGCLAAFAFVMCEEAPDLAAESMEERKERQLAGLAVRWNMLYR